MSGVIIAGNTSGSVTLDAPDVAGTTVITLPTTSGTMALSGGAGSFTTLAASGVATFSAGSASAPALTTTGDTNTGIFFPAADTVAFAEGGTEVMRIDSSGNLGVGITTNITGAKLFVDGGPGLTIDRTASSNGFRQLYIGSGGTAGVLNFWNGTNQASLSVAGAWTNASDARLKKDITDIKYGLTTVNELQPRSYKRVDVDGEHIGFVAQELKQVIPEVVHGDEESQYSVDYGSLVAVAFKAIQEQQALIENLTTRLSALENK